MKKRKTSLRERDLTKYLISLITYLTLNFIPLEGWAQLSGEQTTDSLVTLGFENVRWKDTPEERIYVIENNVYKLQGMGISCAIDLIQRQGLPSDKPCRLIVTDCNIPQVSLTYHPHANDSLKALRNNWQVSYDLGEGWKIVKNEKKKNSSLFKVDILVYPQLNFKNYIITQIYQVLFELSPAIEVSMWPGMKLTAQMILPIYNDGYGRNARRVRPGFLTLAQAFRLPYNIKGRATLGVFNTKTFGAELDLFYPFKDQRFSIQGKFGYVGRGYWSGFKFKYDNEYLPYWSVGGNFYWPQYNTQFKLRAEQYLLKEKGVKIEMIRHFRFVSIGFYAMKAEQAKSNGGFKFFITLPPYKQKRHKYWPRISSSLGTGITYNAGNERYYYKMPASNADRNILQENQFNPYFIKSELTNY